MGKPARRTAVAALLGAALLAGCSYFVSWDDIMSSWVGNDMQDILNLWGPADEVTPLAGGNTEYRYHRKALDPSCFHTWIVNPQGVIAGYRYQGRCRPI